MCRWRGSRQNATLQKSKKQHYVPQAYLQNFAYAGRLSVLDCNSSRVFASSVRDVGHENSFYDYDPSVKTTGGIPHPDLQETERLLANIDGIQARRIKLILAHAAEWPRDMLSVALRQLCSPAFIQFSRTPQTRETLMMIRRLAAQSVVDKMCEANFPDIPAARRPRVSEPSENAAVRHADYMFDNRRRREWSEALLPQTWYVGRASTDLGFVCSDNPVVRSAKVCDLEHRIELRGMGQYGASYFWPLDRKHVLVVRDFDFFEEERELEGTVVSVQPGFVKAMNLLQVKSCKRFVYGNQKDFSPIQDWIRSPDGIAERSKADVEVTHAWSGENRSRMEVRVLR